MIIGLSGHIKSGKTTAANLIKESKKYTEKYFAFKLKFIAAFLTGDDIKNFETQEGKEGFLSEWGMTRRKMLQILGTESLRNNFHDNVWIKALFADYKPQCKGYCARMKQADDPSCTCELDCDCMPNWIISDVRFKNEADAIKERGGIIIRINRPFSKIYPVQWLQYIQLYGGEKENFYGSDEGFIIWTKNNDEELYKKISHQSEVELDDYQDFDLIINNTNTVQEYEQQLRDFLNQKNLI